MCARGKENKRERKSKTVKYIYTYTQILALITERAWQRDINTGVSAPRNSPEVENEAVGNVIELKTQSRLSKPRKTNIRYQPVTQHDSFCHKMSSSMTFWCFSKK